MDGPLQTGAPDRGRLVAGAVATTGLALVAALLVGGSAPGPAIPGLPDAGQLTGWSLPLLRALRDLAAVATIGVLLTGSVLMSVGQHGVLAGPAARVVRSARGWALLWAAGALVTATLTLSDILGAPLWELDWGTALTGQARALPQIRALAVTFVLVAALAVLAGRSTTVTGSRWLLVLALAALLPTIVTGHSSGSGDHYQATTSLALHVVTASLWVGGLFGLVLHGRRAGVVTVTAAQRFSLLALVCFVGLALSGTLTAWTRLGGLVENWWSPYGRVVLAKSLLLLVLGVLGWQHRRRTLAALDAARPGAFLRLAGVEALVMSAAIGLAAGLSQSPTPPPEAVVATHGEGHSTLPLDLEPFAVSRLVTDWTLDSLVISTVALALGSYLMAVRRVRVAGIGWSGARTGAAVAAGVVTLVALCGGLATYSTAMISLQVAQFFVMLLVVPALIVLSGPLSLRAHARAGGPADQAVVASGPGARLGRLLADPTNGLIMVVVVLLGLYATPLLDWSLRSPGAHLLANAAALTAGTAGLWSLLGVDQAPAHRRPAWERTAWLVTLFAFLAVVGFQLASRDGVLGGAWFAELDWGWVDMAVDQRRAASVAWAFLLVLAPALLLVIHQTADRARQTR